MKSTCNFVKQQGRRSSRLDYDAITNFSTLPSEAFVPLQVVCNLYSCAPATAWRRVKSGHIPSPHRLGARSSRWNVGELRQSLCNEVAR